MDAYDEFLKMLAATPSKDAKKVEETSSSAAVIESNNVETDPELEQVPYSNGDAKMES